MDFNMAAMLYLFDILSVAPKVDFASDSGISGKNNELMINLMRHFEGDTYVTGLGAHAYLDQDLFDKAGIQVRWLDFAYPPYPQLHGPFEPDLSTLDFIFNAGAEEAARHCRRNDRVGIQRAAGG
jgi:hypothetical protein